MTRETRMSLAVARRKRQTVQTAHRNDIKSLPLHNIQHRRINAVVVMQSFLARVISYTVCLFVSHDKLAWHGVVHSGD